MFATLLAWAAPAQAQTASAKTTAARAKANVVGPLSLINTGALSFGDLAAGPTPGTVVISPAGARTTTGGVTALGGTVSSAAFTGAASGLNIVIIRFPQIPVTLDRVGGGAAMRISAFTIEGGQLRVFLTRQAFDFRIGGTLQVGARQMEGAYEGKFDVTIDYY